jgi:isopentenyl diphosphate isomerase/L-lactate dehydrogenase-like FMN-dependent dehydrogenase
VDRLLDWFRADMARTMTLIGAEAVAELDHTFINAPV